MSKLSDFELGWLVGILEGEGTFGISGRRMNGTGTQQIRVKMTDQDVIFKISALFDRITGLRSNIRTETSSNPNAQIAWIVEISGERARMVMKEIVKHMHYRRRARIWQSLNKYTPPKDIGREKLFRLLDIGDYVE